MIALTVELLRRGNRGDRHVLGRVEVYNDETGTDAEAHYVATRYGADGRTLRSAGFTLPRGDHWALVERAMAAVGGGA